MSETAIAMDNEDTSLSPTLQASIDLDRLLAVRRAALLALPVNMILSIANLLVGISAGDAGKWTLWLAASVLANALRTLLCYTPYTAEDVSTSGSGLKLSPRMHMRLHTAFALFQGAIWACVPALCIGYSPEQTLYYLTVICGITAGSAVYGFSYAPIPMCFITPVLLSVTASLLWAGGFERDMLAGTVLLYLAGLTKGAIESQAAFAESSRLKHQATAMARSLQVARERATEIAEQMRHRALHDPLTGLSNSRGFMEATQTLLSRRPDATSCLMLLDLDGFKWINDTFGHKVGDNVLIEVGRRLRAALPKEAHIARLGGDEFAVLYEPATAHKDQEALALDLVAAIAVPFASFDTGRIGVSIGIDQASQDDIDAMLMRADSALYAAKARGRNQIYQFDETLRSLISMRRTIENDLPAALASGQIDVWFQPIMGAGGSSIDSFEALLRWKHDTYGWISPPDIIGTASLSNHADALTRYIVDKVCAAIRVLQAQNLPQLRIAMNISPRQMMMLAVDEIVLTKLAAHGVPAGLLEIEITEETALDIRAVQAKLTALAAAGVRIAIDDFGVGYSSLASLRQLHARRIKIDKTFIAGIPTAPADQALVEAIVQLGRSLAIEVVAEGVENAEQADKLRDLGCGLMQGYHFAEPMPLANAITWIKTFPGPAGPDGTPAGSSRLTA